jgi:chemotaxis protein MotB
LHTIDQYAADQFSNLSIYDLPDLKQYVMRPKIVLAIFLVSALLQACVSNKKHQASVGEVQRLTAENNTLQQQVSTCKQQVDQLTESNKSTNAQFSSYKSECEAAKEKLNAYRSAMMEEIKTLKAMGDVIEQAVDEFTGRGMEVDEKNGRIYVSFEEGLLYTSGSANISESGLKALEALSGALNKYPNLQVIVVGHTDNVKFKGGINDNLNLSTQRANGVVRALRDKFSVAPERLVAAGQGGYAPIADNSTVEGRAKNRRTEIILNPDYEKIWSHVQANE